MSEVRLWAHLLSKQRQTSIPAFPEPIVQKKAEGYLTLKTGNAVSVGFPGRMSYSFTLVFLDHKNIALLVILTPYRRPPFEPVKSRG